MEKTDTLNDDHTLHRILTNEQVINLETAMWGNYWCDKCGEPIHDCKQFGCEFD